MDSFYREEMSWKCMSPWPLPATVLHECPTDDCLNMQQNGGNESMMCKERRSCQYTNMTTSRGTEACHHESITQWMIHMYFIHQDWTWPLLKKEYVHFVGRQLRMNASFWYLKFFIEKIYLVIRPQSCQALKIPLAEASIWWLVSWAIQFSWRLALIQIAASIG